MSVSVNVQSLAVIESVCSQLTHASEARFKRVSKLSVARLRVEVSVDVSRC